MAKMEEEDMHLTVLFRGKSYPVAISKASTVGDFGKKLQELTSVAYHTMRLLLPHGRRLAASALLPMSDQHASLPLDKSGLAEGQVIRLMGALPEEVNEVSQPVAKRAEARILGFEEEDRRAKQRATLGGGQGRQLPLGSYVFSEFRALHLPGVELNPPPQRALEIMHKLASDPGIVAIMNKHRWQVGVMTELAPVGYVGVSPKCLLGFNKNRGEEISLRLRTDDLEGFRKFESIKKTLLHELAHMVHDDHDEKFHALDKQLNEEATALDWTRSKGHTVSGARNWHEQEDNMSMDVGGVTHGHKLGGVLAPRDARAAAAEAAILRVGTSQREPDPDTDDESDEQAKASTSMGRLGLIRGTEKLSSVLPDYRGVEPSKLPLPLGAQRLSEPDPDEKGQAEATLVVDYMDFEPSKLPSSVGVQGFSEPDPDESGQAEAMVVVVAKGEETANEPDPDEATTQGVQDVRAEPDPDDALGSINSNEEKDMEDNSSGKDSHYRPFGELCSTRATSVIKSDLTGNGEADLDMRDEPDPDEVDDGVKRHQEPNQKEHGGCNGIHGTAVVSTHSTNGRREEPDRDYMSDEVYLGNAIASVSSRQEPDPDETGQEPIYSFVNESQKPGMDESLKRSQELAPDESLDWDVVDDELRRIQDAAAAATARLQAAIATLKQQASPSEMDAAVQALFTILKNVMEHPDEAKFRRLRKGNPTFQHRVANYEGAVEVLRVVGFAEGECEPGGGGSDCLVLRHCDPGLCWLARSYLEAA